MDKKKIVVGGGDSIIIAIIITLVFGGYSVFAFFLFYRHMAGDYSLDHFVMVFSKDCVMVLAAIPFMLLALYFLFCFFKPPKKYLARLIERQNDTLKGKEVTKLVFEIDTQKKMSQYISNRRFCYVEGHGNYIPGAMYTIGLKEINWDIKSVDPPSADAQTTMANINMKPVVWTFAFIIGGGNLFCIFLIVYDLIKGRPIWMDLFALVILVLMLALSMFIFRLWYKDNTITEKIRTGRGPSSGEETLPNALKGSTKFKVHRHIINTISEKYTIMDEYENPVYELSMNPLTNMSIKVVDAGGMEVGKIDHSIFDATEKYVVRLDGIPEFIVRRKLTAGSFYEIKGLDYIVTGDFRGVENYILDLSNEPQASIMLEESGTRMGSLGCKEIVVSEGVQNNIYLVFIAACVTMENYHMTRRRQVQKGIVP